MMFSDDDKKLNKNLSTKRLLTC